MRRRRRRRALDDAAPQVEPRRDDDDDDAGDAVEGERGAEEDGVDAHQHGEGGGRREVLDDDVRVPAMAWRPRVASV